MDIINYMAIGDRIRKFRTASGMTQASLSELSKVEPSNISHIERGATKVSLPTLLKIANALQVSLDDLVYDSIAKSSHISYKELDELLTDCTDAELKAILETAKTIKSVLRNLDKSGL